MYRLVMLKGGEMGQPLTTDRPRLVLGRSCDCDYVLTAPGVWEQHAVIEARPNGYYVATMSAAATVRVNGETVSERRLRSGDEIELGTVRLRFELVHGVQTTGRRPSLLSWVAGFIVAALGLGQLAVLGWIFSQPRPRDMQVQTSRHLSAEPPALLAREAAAETQPAETVDRSSRVATPAAPFSLDVLPRMIDLLQVERSDTADAVLVKVTAKAQVGARQFDVAAAAVAVVPYGVDAAGRTAPRAEPLWLKLPAVWENFTVKTLAARFPGSAADYAGFVVWSFYRGQVQDVAAAPAELLALARVPPQR